MPACRATDLARSAPATVTLPRATGCDIDGFQVVGETFGTYRIVRKLGEGGMGAVFLGEHARLDRRVAIKLLRAELSSNQEVLNRFFTEARATSLIHHPNIVEIFDCDIDPRGRAFIMMEFLDGETLADRLAKGPMPPEQVRD